MRLNINWFTDEDLALEAAHDRGVLVLLNFMNPG